MLLFAEWSHLSTQDASKENVSENFRSFIASQEASIEKIAQQEVLPKLTALSNLSSFPDEFAELSKNEGFEFFVHTHREMLFWSGQTIPVSLQEIINPSFSGLVKLQNGWYLSKRYEKEGLKILCLKSVLSSYPYQNDYLPQGFKTAFPLEILLSTTQIDNSESLTDENGNIIGYFQLLEKSETSNYAQHEVVLSILGLALLILSLFFRSKSIDKGKQTRVNVILILSIIILRFLSFTFKIPSVLYATELFDPAFYATSNLLPTLGDLFFNVLTLSICLRLLARCEGMQLLPKNKFLTFGVGILVSFLMYSICELSNLLIGLINNSTISLDVNDLFSLNKASYVSFFIIALVFSCIQSLLKISNHHITNAVISRNNFVIIIAAATLFVYFFQWIDSDKPEIIHILTISFLILVSYFNQRKHLTRFRYTRTVLLLAVFAFFATYLIVHYSLIREKEQRKYLAAKLATERDPIAESLFEDIEKRIQQDSLLKKYLKPNTKVTGAVKDLSQIYFNGYWERYSIQVNVFSSDDCPMTSFYTTSVSDPGIFDQLIDSVGIPTASEHFFYLDNASGRISYIARLEIYDSIPAQNPLGTLYIEFDSRYTPEEIGYPELLLDKVVSANSILSHYSYARYKNGKLVSHYGDFNYGLTDDYFAGNLKEEFRLTTFDDYSHLLHEPGGDIRVILSLPQLSILEVLTPFSYFMLFFGLLASVPEILNYLFQKRYQRLWSLKNKIQFAIIATLFLAMLTIGAGTVYYIISNSNEKNKRNMSEKINSLLIEASFQLGDKSDLPEYLSEDISYNLIRLSNVFFSDINIYNINGQLYASSRSKIFEEGLISKRMNPSAFLALSKGHASEFNHQEQIGNLNYLSSYIPLRNKENEITGYLNMPYFARQNELQREISTFVVAVINIYVLLIVLVLIIAIFISNTVTSPLRFIQEKLAGIKLGGKNEPIDWKGEDEIGALIREYNRMVNELAENIEKLARSERESAWREMAKQVAHEIKNPLTPMKLSVQYLKKAWDDKADDMDNRIDRFTKTLIEQIDTLSNIATEFSNFAKMPRMKKEPINLAKLLDNVVEFNKDSQNSEIICTISPVNDSFIVYSDKEQMLRVFNNLIKNAQQAIPESRKGIIELILSRWEDTILIEIKDNGVGIDEAIRDKIFSPNFTTKNTGMGLGLALVKTIIENSDGSIRFETISGEGTSFFISLPAYSE